jgi:hypothetical protein
LSPPWRDTKNVIRRPPSEVEPLFLVPFRSLISQPVARLARRKNGTFDSSSPTPPKSTVRLPGLRADKSNNPQIWQRRIQHVRWLRGGVELYRPGRASGSASWLVERFVGRTRGVEGPLEPARDPRKTAGVVGSLTKAGGYPGAGSLAAGGGGPAVPGAVCPASTGTRALSLGPAVPRRQPGIPALRGP